MDSFEPMQAIPSTVCLTSYGGGPLEFMKTPLNDLLKQIEVGKLPLQVGRVFQIDEIVLAHETVDNNLARGKIVDLTG